MATIALVNTELAGHAGPAIRLGAVLTRQGHRVLAWAPERHRDQVEATGMVFHRCQPLPPDRGLPGIVGKAATLAQATDRCSGELIEQVFAADVELVVHNCNAPWGRVAADFLGLPRIVSNPLFPRYSQRFLSFTHAIARGEPSAEETARMLEASRLSVLRRWGVDLGAWPETIHSQGETTISYTTAEIAGGQRLVPGWRYVGPLMTPAPKPEPRGARPLVYVAFGTVFNDRAESFRTVIDALAGDQFDVLVSLGGGRNPVSIEQLEPMPANVEVHPHVASREVLARASVHVTHGGCSSVHESLLAGVPMVVLPQGSDQTGWAERVEALGAGQIVPMDAGAVRAAVLALADDRARRRVETIGQELAAFDGDARVARAVQHALSGQTRRPSAA